MYQQLLNRNQHLAAKVDRTRKHRQVLASEQIYGLISCNQCVSTSHQKLLKNNQHWIADEEQQQQATGGFKHQRKGF